MTKRLRIFAGPNGSGKSSIYDELRKIGQPNFGIYVNADVIESTLKSAGVLNFRDFKISVVEDDLRNAYLSFLSKNKHIDNHQNFKVNDNFLVLNNRTVAGSYFACFLADYIRNKMLDSGIGLFTIETVMSHPSKLDFIERAKECGYRVYLYYVATDSPIVNAGRVEERVANGGHDVDKEKIEKRYYRSLDNLFHAIELSDRAYLFDNSGKNHIFLAEYDGSTSTLTVERRTLPNWMNKYVIEKNNDKSDSF